MNELEPLRAAIAAAVAAPARELLQAYFDSDGTFAGATFDRLGGDESPANELTPTDLLAASLLDVAMPAQLVRAIAGSEGREFSDLLRAIPSDVDLWDATDVDLKAAEALWQRLRTFSGVDWVKAGKILARKRPRLVPVLDSVVMAALPLAADDAWNGLREAIRDEALRNLIEGARPDGLDPAITTLRVLDVALWMRGSGSRSARKVRKAVGLSG